MSFSHRRLLLMIGLVTAIAAHGAAAGQSSGTQPYQAGTSAVIVDVVVRDDDRPVTDLTVDDFEVFEDGVRQTIASFERRMPGSPQGASSGVTEATAVPAPPPGGAPDISITALAWDQLTPEGRALAAKATDALVESRQPDELIGVFLVDRALRTLQPYTTDAGALEQAVAELSVAVTTQTGREPDSLNAGRIPRPSTPPTAGAETAVVASPSRDPRTIGEATDPGRSNRELRPRRDQSPAAAVYNALELMEINYDRMLADIQALGSIDGLLAIVGSLGSLPGRKTVVYFCEGLTVAPSVEARFRSVIETANRKNVSIYALDAAGLRVHSKQLETMREINALSSETIAGVDRDNSKKWTEDLERNEQALKLNPSASLGTLTGETGGLLIQNTNDLQKGIARINDDRRHHYLLTYVSTNQALDGTYRRIDVKVKRRGVDVSARRGYLAVPVDDTGPVLPYEAPAIAALAATPHPSAFPVRAAALSVPTPGKKGLTAIVVGVDGRSLTYAEDPRHNSYRADATILARIDDGFGKPVRKQSQQYELSGAIPDLAKAQQGGILFFRSPELATGRYTLMAAVHDGRGSRSSVARVEFDVPETSGTVVGSLFIVGRVERLQGNEAEADHPLAAGPVLLYPSLGEPISRKGQAELPFALPIVVDPAEGALSAILELLQDGRPLASLQVPLDAPGSDGRLVQVSRLPTAAIPPGTYELRVTVKAGQRSEVRTTTVTITD